MTGADIADDTVASVDIASRNMMLHEAMVEVLSAHGGGWMTRDEIALEIARRDLFRRPSDGRHPPSDQLRLRARKPEYQHLFECSDTACTRIRLRPGVAAAPGAADEAQDLADAGSRSTPAVRRPRAPSPTTAGKQRSGAAPADRRRGTGASWYEELRERYRPDRLRVLLIGESPPDPGDGERRFLYSPVLRADNLYRGVAQALYGERDDVDLTDKPDVLRRFQSEGLWLIDAVDEPVNKLGAPARARAIESNVPRLVERCAELAPELGVIVCHGKVYKAAAEFLREAGIAVLHDEPLPFPLGNWRAKFVTGFRRALVAAVPGLPERLARVMPEDEVARWAATPIEALDERTVLAAILSGDQAAVLELVANLE